MAEIPPSRSLGTMGLGEENYYKLLKIAIDLDLVHILEWTCFSEYNHMKLLRLSKLERDNIYRKTRKSVLSEQERRKSVSYLKGRIQ